MEGFTVVDGIVAVVIILSAILAYSRGVVRELMAIVGWIGAAVLAFIFAPSAQPIIKELPVVGDFLRDSCELSIIAAFAGVFAIGLILAALFTPLLSSVVQRSALGGVDQGLGIAMIDDSRSAKVFASFQANIDAQVPTDAPGWILQRYNDLTQACAAGDAAPATDTPVTPAP